MTTTITYPDANSAFFPTVTDAVSNELPAFSEMVIDAINSRRVIAFRYTTDRHPRLFAPYIFRHAKNGNYVMNGMQIENPNSLDGDNERRTFDVSKIKTMELTTNTFVPADTFSPDEPSLQIGIIACVLPWE